MKINRRSLYTVSFFAVLASFSPCRAQEKIVAVVNNDIITQKDLTDFVNFMTMQYRTEYQGEELQAKIQSVQKDLLDKLIDDRLIVQEAKNSDIKIDESRVKARINEIKKQYPSETQFQSALSQQGLVQADLEAKIREQMMMYFFIDMQIKNKIIVKPSEVTDFYENNPHDFEIPEQREFDAVTLEDDTLAKEISQKVKNGQSLDEALKGASLSANKICASRGGQLKKEIEEVIFNLKVGEVSVPLKIEGKYYIFKLNNSKAPRKQSLFEVQEKVSALLSDKKMQEKLNMLLNERKNKSYIKIF